MGIKKKKPSEALINEIVKDLDEYKSEDVTALLPENLAPQKESAEPELKVSFGLKKSLGRYKSSLGGTPQYESHLAQAENLRIAQTRILELEKEIETLRQENEMLASASEIAKQRAEDFFVRLQMLERSKIEELDQAQMEMKIYKDTIVEKEKELVRSRLKIEELESRLNADLKKIRVRERELENRLELSKMEKIALLRAKDESILDLKKKIEELNMELDGYKNRCQELNIKVEANHEQLSRTVKALRLALTNLEVSENVDKRRS